MIRIDRNRLRGHPHQELQLQILESALAAVAPATLIAERLIVRGNEIEIDGMAFPLEGRRIWIVAVGKAAVAMAEAALDLVGPDRVAGGVAVTRTGYGGRLRKIEVIEAAHPIPRDTSGAQAIERLAAELGSGDMVLCLLSGGGSALLASPPAAVPLSDLARTTEQLLHCGADIDEVNTVRRHVSRLSGGQLLERLHPARVVTLVLSDVITDRLESIASGPTVPDPTTFADAHQVLVRHGLWDRIPASVQSHLASGLAGLVADTPKPGGPIFETAYTALLGGNATAVAAAAAEARRLGLQVRVAPAPLDGEARDAARRTVDQALCFGASACRPFAYLAGGETTVTVTGGGQGGRNQEFALAAALQLRGRPGICLAALASDGWDGSTDAAGALVDGDTAEMARRHGVDPDLALSRNDSHAALSAADDVLWTGPTRTNVADLCVIVGEPRAGSTSTSRT